MNWKISKEDMLIVDLIVKRACPRIQADPLDLSMDIIACHCNGNPLDLTALLHADDFQFDHDIVGIYSNLNRLDGKLLDNFTPRFSRQF